MNTDNTMNHNRISKLPQVLRTIGTMSVLLAAISFLLFGSDTVDDGGRYLYLLGFSTLTAGSGLWAARYLRDAAAARNLLALTAALLPVHTCILGAFLLSSLGTGEFSSYPSALVWSVPSLSAAVIYLGVGFPILTALSALAFAVLDRPRAKDYALTYALTNAVVLIPIRTPLFAFLTAVVVVILALAAVKRMGEFAITKESLICRVLLLAPAVSIAIRSMFSHDNSLLMVGGVFLVLAYFVFELSYETTKWKVFSHVSGALFHTLGVLLLCIEVQNEGLSQLLPDIFPLFFFSVLSASALLYGLDHRVNRSVLARLSFYSFCSGVCMQFLFSANIVTALLIVLTGTAFLIVGDGEDNSQLRAVGLVQIAAGFFFYVWLAVSEAFEVNSWFGLSLLGVALILSANALPKFVRTLTARKGGGSGSDLELVSDREVA